jgi:CBS domain-containing protein
MAVGALVEQDRQRGGHGVYPVVEDGRTLGILFTSRLHGQLRRSRPDQLVSEAAIPLDRAPTYGPDEPLIHAVERLETLRTDSLPVVDPAEPSRLYGIMTREKALERLRMRHHLATARGDSASLGERG